MTEETYEIVEHDGGWAYRVGSVYSETFPTHEDALAAARFAARRQELADESRAISYQDDRGQWHVELADGHDRPHTDVKDGE